MGSVGLCGKENELKRSGQEVLTILTGRDHRSETGKGEVKKVEEIGEFFSLFYWGPFLSFFLSDLEGGEKKRRTLKRVLDHTIHTRRTGWKKGPWNLLGGGGVAVWKEVEDDVFSSLPQSRRALRESSQLWTWLTLLGLTNVLVFFVGTRKNETLGGCTVRRQIKRPRATRRTTVVIRRHFPLQFSVVCDNVFGWRV